MKVKDSYNLDRLAIAAATAALGDLKQMRQNADTIIRTRGELATALIELGFDVAPSEANFLLCRPSNLTAPQLQKALEERKILIRHYNINPVTDWVRISIGNEDETKALLTAIREITAAATST